MVLSEELCILSSCFLSPMSKSSCSFGDGGGVSWSSSSVVPRERSVLLSEPEKDKKERKWRRRTTRNDE